MTKPVKVIAVSGGKGGVGKTNVSVNLAVSLAQQNQRVLLLDADLGLANIDILLGLNAKQNLNDVVEGRADIRDVMIEGPAGIKIIPASSGTQSLTQITAQAQAALIQAFEWLSGQVDVLIVDTAAGISESVTRFLTAVQQVVVVLTNEPTSITDAYALIKVMSQEYQLHRFHILANMVKNEKEARQVFGKLLHASDRFLDVSLEYIGYIPYDEHVKKSVRKQRCVVDLYPSSQAGLAFKQIAEGVSQWPVSYSSSGNVSFFIHHLSHNQSMAASL